MVKYLPHKYHSNNTSPNRHYSSSVVIIVGLLFIIRYDTYKFHLRFYHQYVRQKMHLFSLANIH